MEPDLVERARRGDTDAFALLVHQVSDRLFAIAFRILRDAGLAEDALQNALLAAWRELPGLRDPRRFDAWIHRILVHACYAEVGRRNRSSALVRVIPPGAADTADIGTSLADRDELERVFRRLPMEQRAVFVLHHYLGISLVEIAGTLGIPAGTVRSRLHYATRALREGLESVRPDEHLEDRSA